MIIDTHAHLYYPDLKDNLKNILDKASESGINQVIVPAVDLKTAEIVLDLSVKYKEIYPALGFHPGDLKNFQLSDLKYLENYLKEDKVLAVGEIGLDYYWDKSEIDKQKKFFSEQLEISKDFNLPVIIHTRESVDDALLILKQHNPSELRGQFHCFSGNELNLKEIIKLENFYVSYCGNVTYKNFKELSLLKNTPVNRLLFETDSPFLTPVPFRGKTNQPAFLIHTIKKISDVLNVELSALKNMVYKNTVTLFNL